MMRKLTNVRPIKNHDEFVGACNADACVIMVNAKWCDVSKSVAGEYVKLSMLHQDIPFFQVDTEECFSLVAKTLKVTSYPAFFFYKLGVCKKVIVGGNIAELKQSAAEFAFL